MKIGKSNSDRIYYIYILIKICVFSIFLNNIRTTYTASDQPYNYAGLGLPFANSLRNFCKTTHKNFLSLRISITRKKQQFAQSFAKIISHKIAPFCFCATRVLEFLFWNVLLLVTFTYLTNDSQDEFARISWAPILFIGAEALHNTYVLRKLRDSHKTHCVPCAKVCKKNRENSANFAQKIQSFRGKPRLNIITPQLNITRKKWRLL